MGISTLDGSLILWTSERVNGDCWKILCRELLRENTGIEVNLPAYKAGHQKGNPSLLPVHSTGYSGCAVLKVPRSGTLHEIAQ